MAVAPSSVIVAELPAKISPPSHTLIMALPAGRRETRNGSRSQSSGRNTGRRTSSARDETEDDDGDEGGPEHISVPIDEFMGWAQGAINKGDPAALARLRVDLIEARRKKNYYKQRAKEAEGEVPEDAVILTGPEAEAYTKLAARPNFDFSKLPGLVETLENDKATLSAENIKLKNTEIFGEFSKTSGYNRKAIAGAVDNLRLHAEMGDVTVEKTDAQGKKSTETQKTLKVRKASDPKAPLVPFDELITKEADYLWPALKAKEEGQQQQDAGQHFSMAPQGGPSGGQQGGGSLLQNYIANANQSAAASGSPLQRGAAQQGAQQQQRGRNPSVRQ